MQVTNTPVLLEEPFTGDCFCVLQRSPEVCSCDREQTSITAALQFQTLTLPGTSRIVMIKHDGVTLMVIFLGLFLLPLCLLKV